MTGPVPSTSSIVSEINTSLGQLATLEKEKFTLEGQVDKKCEQDKSDIRNKVDISKIISNLSSQILIAEQVLVQVNKLPKQVKTIRVTAQSAGEQPIDKIRERMDFWKKDSHDSLSEWNTRYTHLSIETQIKKQNSLRARLPRYDIPETGYLYQKPGVEILKQLSRSGELNLNLINTLPLTETNNRLHDSQSLLLKDYKRVLKAQDQDENITTTRTPPLSPEGNKGAKILGNFKR